MADEEPKIYVDDDWKQEAQREKERLAEQDAGAQAPGQWPAASFPEIVNMLSMQVLIGLGGMSMGDGKEIPGDLTAAKHHIDLMDILQQKTQGNLSAEEQDLLEGTLHELRMAFVRIAGVGKGSPPNPDENP